MKKSDQFDKFKNKVKGSAIKEQLRQEKKAEKRENEEGINKRFEEKRQLRAAQRADDPRRKQLEIGKKSGETRAGKKSETEKRFETGKPRVGKSRVVGDRNTESKPRFEGSKPRVGKSRPESDRNAESKPRFEGSKPRVGKSRVENDRNSESKPRFESSKPRIEKTRGESDRKPAAGKRFESDRKAGDGFKSDGRKRIEKGAGTERSSEGKKHFAADKKTESTETHSKPAFRKTDSEKSDYSAEGSTANMPLNKYIAHSGVCSRRDAAILVKEGKVTVNGTPATDPGFKITEDHVVKVNGKKVVPSRNNVYILLNKPKDYITTLEDPQGRKTVLDLVKHATDERIYPIGRLDRNTSGVLLLTNDGELAQILSHPKFEIKKVYHVGLDKPLTKNDFEKIIEGIQLEDGMTSVDSLAYADTKDKTQIGIEIHSGKNRIVRRIFEHLGYDVKTLDRVMYAGLTKKNVQRGKWRLLTDKEVRILKHFNSTKKTKAANAKNAR